MALAVVGFAMVLLGAASLLYLQRPLQESQDIRQQASVADGNVEISFAPESGSQFLLTDPGVIEFSVNTNNIQVDGVQLVFNVVTDTLLTPPEFILDDNAGLQIAYQQIETTADGFLVSVIMIGEQIASPFSTANEQVIGELRFNPSISGQMTLNFDVENSIATVYNSNPPEDELKTIPTVTYNVYENNSQTSPTPTPSPSPTTEVSPSPTAEVSPSPTGTPSPTPTSTITPSPTPTDNGGGTGGVSSCNQNCSSNNDCEANHRCYNGQCRLATNVSSTTCSQPADAGLSFSCNEYCANSSECATGLNCYFNRCRNPLNLDNTSCAAPTQQMAQAIVSSCNQACSSHKDCAANLLCNPSTNTCRLATNPGSTTCTPSEYKSVSNTYNKGASGSGGSNNGGTTGASSTVSTPTPAVVTSPSPTMTTVGQEPTTGNQNPDLPIKDETALQSLISYINTSLENRGVSLPLLLIMSGLLLLVILVVIWLITKSLGRRPNTPPTVTPVGRDQQKDTQYKQQLANKINTLKKQQAASSPTASPLSTPSPAPGASTSPTTGQPPSAMVSRPAPSPRPTPPSPPPAATTPSNVPSPQAPPPQAAGSNNGSNMMDKIKSKGITPPGQNS